MENIEPIFYSCSHCHFFLIPNMKNKDKIRRLIPSFLNGNKYVCPNCVGHTLEQKDLPLSDDGTQLPMNCRHCNKPITEAEWNQSPLRNYCRDCEIEYEKDMDEFEELI